MERKIRNIKKVKSNEGSAKVRHSAGARLRNRSYLAALLTLCATFLCCAIFAFTGLLNGAYPGGNVAHGLTVSDFSWDSTAPTLTFTKGGQKYTSAGAADGSNKYASNEEAWNAAITYSVASKKVAKFTLSENWTATAATIDELSTTQFGDPAGVGIHAKGGLMVPQGAKIQLDLNGKTLDRGLYTPNGKGTSTANLPLTAQKQNRVNSGFVIYVEGALDTAKYSQLEIIDSTATAGYDIKDTGIFKKGTTTEATGMIRGGCADEDFAAGGVHVNRAGFRLTSGLIAYNHAKQRGAGLYATNANIYMTGGAIAYNVDPCDDNDGVGGGIYLGGGSIFREMYGGSVAYNYCKGLGGGLYTAVSGGVALNLDVERKADGNPVRTGDVGMQFFGNKSDSNGGAVYLNKENTLKLGTCKITKNIAVTGGGVSFHKEAYQAEIHGDPCILENVNSAGQASNLYFVSGAPKIKVTGNLIKHISVGSGGGAVPIPQIGIRMANMGGFTENFVATHGASETASDYFMSDNAAYTVNISKGVEGSLIALNSYQAVWNTAVNNSIRNGGTEQQFDMDPNSSITGDWNATNGSFGTGIGFTSNGALMVPAGANIKINLKSRAINRKLTARLENGYVIQVLGTLTVTGTNPTLSATDGSITKAGGMITGGYSGNTGASTTLSQTGGVRVESGAIFNLQGGAIYNNLADSGQNDGDHNGGIGVCVDHGTFNMSGGFVSKNRTVRTKSSIDNVGVALYSASTLNMTGGEISWNECAGTNHSHSAGVGLGTNSVLNMSGGSIKNNKTWATCGGVSVGYGTFNMSGGSITGNTAAGGNSGSGGGIGIASSSTVNFSGNINISGNKGLASGMSNDIEWLGSSNTKAINITGTLATTSRIGMNPINATYPNNGITVFTSGLKTKGGITDVTTMNQVFFSNDPLYKAVPNSAGEVTFSKLTTYDEVWQASVNISKNNNAQPVTFKLGTVGTLTDWNATSGSFGTATNCYENGSLLVPSGATIVIDLNGYKINRGLTAARANGQVLTVKGTCTIQDSDGTTVNTSGNLVPKTSGRTGGAITGGYSNSESGAGGVVLSSGTLTLKSGCIYGNKTAYEGHYASAGLYTANGSTFNMNGGYISKNIVEGTGADGGVEGCGVQAGGTMIMTAGEISYNESKQIKSSNGTVAAYKIFSMSGGSIKNNKSASNHAGLYILSTDATLSGSITLSGNTTTGTGTVNDVTFSKDTHMIKIGSKITASAPIRVNRTGTFTSGAKGKMTVAELRSAFTAADSSKIVGQDANNEGYIGTPVTALATANKTYNTASQTLINNFDKNKVTATLSYNSGTASTVTAVTGTNAGSYKFVFTLKSGYVWNDSALNYSADSTVTKTLTATMSKSQVNSITWGTVTKTYDGNALTASVTDFGTANTLTNKPEVADMFTIAGTITNAGTQKATATLKDTTNYIFATTIANSTRDSDTVASKTLTVNRKAVTDPTAVASLVYNNSNQTLISNDNTTYMTWTKKFGSGTATTDSPAVTGKAAGTYTFVFTPTANYQWTTATNKTSALTVTVTIAKAQVNSLTWGTLTKTYDEQALTASVSAYDTAKTVNSKPTVANLFTISGTITNAGTADAKAVLKDTSNYEFASTITNATRVSATEAKTTLTVNRKAVTDPTAVTGLSYNNTSQTLVNSSNSTYMTWTKKYASEAAASATDVKGTKAGAYVFVFTPTANYKWTTGGGTDHTGVLTVNVTIAKAQVTGLTWGTITKTYDRQALTASVSAYTLSTDTPVTSAPTAANLLTVAGSITNKGTQKATATLKDTTNYIFASSVSDSTRDSDTVASTTLTINARSITSDTPIAVSGTYTYTGSALTPAYTITNSNLPSSDNALTKDTDFTVSFSNKTNSNPETATAGDLTNAGTVTITITGKGNFKDSTTQTFVINKAHITAYTWDSTSYTYNGDVKQPKIKTVTTAATAGLPADVADMFTYSGGDAENGSHTATAVLKSGYEANYEIDGVTDKKTVTTSFSIALAALSVATATAYVGTYDGKKHKILTAMPTANGKSLSENNLKWYYSSTAKTATDTGWLNFTSADDLPDVTNVADTHTYYFLITADNHTPCVFTRGATVNAKPINADGTTDFASGISASAISETDFVYDGSDQEPTVTVSDSGATITTADYGFTYSNNKNATKSAVLIITAKGNYTGTVQILYTINPRDISIGDIEINGVADKTFNNSAQKISPEVDDKGANIATARLVENTDYTVSYSRDGGATETTDFKSAGTITITVKGKGNYDGGTSRSVSYEIKPYDLSAANAVDIAYIANLTYNATEQTPEPAVTVTFASGAVNLVKDTDFTYSYSDNRDAGSATVTVTGKGNYTLSADKGFTIEQAVISAISGITADSKVYDGTTAATVHFDSATISGNLDGTDLVVETATGEFNDKNQATGKTVTVTVTALGGTAAANYKLSGDKVTLTADPSNGTSVDITPLEIVIAWAWTTYPYDGQPHYPGATVQNICAGDSVTLTTGVDAGVNPTMPNVQYTVRITGVNNNDDGNYVLPSVTNTTFEITTENTPVKVLDDTLTQTYDGTAKKPTIQERDDSGNYVDMEDIASKYTFTFKDSSGATLEGAPTEAGTYTLTVWISPAYSWHDANPNDTQNFTFTINPATVTKVEFEDISGATFVYDKDTTHKVEIDWSTLEVEGALLGSRPAGVSVTYLYDGAAAAGVVGAGTHKVRAVFTVNGNYNAITSIEKEFTVEKQTLDLDGNDYQIAFADNSGATYTGEKYTLAISGTLPDVLSVVYEYKQGTASLGADGVSAVGTYDVIATFTFKNAADSANYKLIKDGAEVTCLTATLTIGKKGVDISGLSFADDEVPYDGNVHKLQVSGTAEGITGISYEYRDSAGALIEGADGVKNAGTYKVTAVFTVDGNYESVAPIEKTLVINKASLTVTANDKTITYGDNPATAAYTATYSGLVGNDTESDLGTLTLRVPTDKYAIYGDAGTYTDAIVASGLSSDNYDIHYIEGTLTVRQRVITVNWYNDSAKNQHDLSYTFDEGVIHTPYAEVSNALAGDTVTVEVKGGQLNVGMNYVAWVDPDSVSDKNYTLPVNGIETTFDINPKPPKDGQIIWDNTTLYYDGTEQIPKAYFYVNENDNSPKQLTVTTDRTAVNAGTYTATVSYDGNYQLNGDKTKTFTIEKRKIYIEIGDNTAMLGSVDVSTTDWSYVAGSLEFVPGEVYTLVFSCGGVTQEGTYPISCAFNCNNADNYDIVYTGSYTKQGDINDGKCGTLTVTAATFDMSGVKYTGLEVTYDGQPHGITVSGLPAGVSASLTYTQNGLGIGSAGAVDAGEYTVLVKFNIAEGYDGYKNIPDVIKTLTIKKAALTVKANDKSIIFGDIPSNNGVSYLVGGAEVEESSLNLEGALTITTDYTQYADAKTYKLTPAGLTAKNYNITFAPGTLTVSPREITVTWYKDVSASLAGTSFSYDYDGNTHTPYAVASGMLNGNAVTLTVAVDGGFKSEAGLNYTARITAVSNANYCVKEEESSITFSIVRKNVIVWDNSPITYNGGAQFPKASYYDEAQGKYVDLTVEVRDAENNVISAINAGNYRAYVVSVPSDVTGDDYYDFKISPKAVTVTVGSDSLTYGEVEGSYLDNLLAGLLAGIDGNLPVKLVCNVNNKSNVGAYAITGEADGEGKDNYVFTFVNGTLTINKANVNTSGILYDGETKTVNYNGLAQSFEIATLPAGVTKITYTYEKDGKTVNASDVIAAGTYTVTARFEVDGNHNAVTGSFVATLVISAAQLTASISFAGGEVTYDGNVHSVYVTGDMTGVTGVTYEYRNSSGILVSANGVKDAGTYTVTAIVSVEANYSAITLSPVTLTIKQAALTVTANNGSIVYGEAPAADGYGCTATGLALGDNLDDLLALTYSYGTVNGVGEYTVTVSGAASIDNYNVTYKTGKLTVKPYTLKESDISWFDRQGGTALGTDNKFVYTYAAGTVNKPYAEAGFAGITLTVTGGQINSGYGYVAEITGITGAAAGNYLLPATGLSVKFDVIPRPLKGNIVWSAEPIYYNGEAQTPKAYYYDEDGNEHEFTLVTTDREAVHAGTYTASVSVDGNYSLQGDTERTFEILARPVFINIGDMTVNYGDTPNVSAVSRGYLDGSLTILATDNYALTFTCANISGIGEYAIEGHFTCDNASDYNVTFTGSWASAGADNGRHGTLKVVKGSYDTGKISFAGTEVTYDGAYHKLVINGLPEGVTAECYYVNGGFGYGNDGVKNAGKYTVTVTFTGNPNYGPIANKTATLTVKKASLTVKAKDGEIIYGDAPSANGVTYSGFAAGESEATLNAIAGGLTYTYSYTQGDNAGDYTITPAGLTSDNYDIIFKAGTLTVKPRTITVTWYDDETRSSQNFRYENDGQYHAPYPVAGGLVNGDAVTLTVDEQKRAQGIDYVATAVLDDPNYVLPTDGTASQKYTIVAKAGTIVWDNAPIYYNGTVQHPDAYYFDEAGALHKIEDEITVQGGNGIDAGDYTAVIYYDGEDRFYPYTILPLEISIVIKNPAAAVVYGNAVDLNQSGWDYAEGSNRFVNGQNPVRLYTDVVAGTPVGDYPVKGSSTSNNYKITFTEGTLTVCKATVNVSRINYTASANYDGSIHGITLSDVPEEIASYTVTYVKGGVSYGTDGVRDAGVYNLVISFTLKDSSNYEAIPDETSKTFEVVALAADLSGVTFADVLDAVYDGTAKEIFVSGTAEGVAGVTYTYAADTAADASTTLTDGKAVNAGTYTVTATFIFGSNYDASGITATKSATLVIKKAALTVTAGAGSVTYGESSFNAGAVGYTVTGLASADTESAVLGTVTLACAGYSQILAAGEHTGLITASGNTIHKNYDIAYVPATLTVLPRVITVASWKKGETDPGAVLDYEYADGVSYIPFAIAGNIANGDNLYLEVITAKNPVGDGYVATVNAIFKADKVTPDNNYVLPATGLTTSFNVRHATPVDLEIVWNYGAAYYNGTALKPAATYYDPVTANFENVNPDWIETFDTEGNPADAIAAGVYTAKVNADKAAAASLTFTNANDPMTFTVAPRKVYITVGDGSGRYGENHSANAVTWNYAAGTLDDNKFIAGDTYSLTLSMDVNSATEAGKYKISAAFAGNDNYDVIFTGGSWVSADADNGRCGTYTVEKAVFDTSKVIVSGLTATYDGTAHKVSVDTGSLPAGVTASVTYTRGGWSYNGATDAGEYLVTVSFVTGGNYEPVADLTKTLTVSKAKLTVTANPNTIKYGDAPSAGGVAYAGLVPADENRAGVLSGTVTYEYSYVKGGNAGVYKITPKGVTADNYDITFVSGALTVEKRVISVIWFNDERMNSQTLKYASDGATHLPYAEAANVLAGDSVTLTVTGAQSAAGVNYLATVTAVSNQNYTLPETGATVSFDIIPESYVIVWEAKPFVFNNTAQYPEAYYYTSNGERVSLKVTVKPNYGASDSSGSSVYAGNYMAVASLVGGSVTITGEFEHPFTIEKRKVTVVINDAGTAYGEDIALNGWTTEGSEGFVSGSPIYLTTAATKSSPVGAYDITGVYAGSDNSYDVTFINGVYTIEKACAPVPVIASKEYTGSKLTADVYDTSVYRVYQNDGGRNVGSYKVILELLDYDNYKWNVDGEDVRSANYTLMFNVTKAENALTAEFVAREIKAGEQINIVTPVAKFGAAQVRYYKDLACTQEVVITDNVWREVEGTYYAKVTVDETANYSGIGEDGKGLIYTFQVTGKLSLALYWGDLDHEYDGTVFTPKAYVTLGNREIELSVTGGQINAGVYNATVSLTALDGTDLSKYAFTTGEGAASTTVQYTINPKEITVRIADAESVYGSDVIDINLFNADRFTVDGTLVGTDNRNSLNLTFACDFGSESIVPAGKYAIVGTCGNKNYKVVFEGSMGSDGTYTVTEASINVLKSETTWFDEQGVITENQEFFITLGDTTEDGGYKYISLSGGQTARITYSTFLARYDSELHDGMTEERIKTILLSDGGRNTPPKVEQGGSWVVYYSIEADSHETKYGIWKVLIEDPDDYIIIKFVKPLPMQYGDVEGRDLLTDLIQNGCIELSGKIIPNLTALRAYTEAYAYEDVTSSGGVVSGSTSVGKYSIRFVFNEDGQRLYGNANFKYSTTNDPDSDTNLDKFEVERRVIDVQTGELEFKYDGEKHLPSITLKNFVGGEDVELTDFELGVKKLLVLSNGDVVGITVKYGGGSEDMVSGSYTLNLEIDNPNYRLGQNASIFVTIEREAPGPVDPGQVALPTWAIIAIAAGGALLLIGIIVAVVIAKKRKQAIIVDNEDGFNDDYQGG